MNNVCAHEHDMAWYRVVEKVLPKQTPLAYYVVVCWWFAGKLDNVLGLYRVSFPCFPAFLKQWGINRCEVLCISSSSRSSRIMCSVGFPSGKYSTWPMIASYPVSHHFYFGLLLFLMKVMANVVLVSCRGYILPLMWCLMLTQLLCSPVGQSDTWIKCVYGSTLHWDRLIVSHVWGCWNDQGEMSRSTELRAMN